MGKIKEVVNLTDSINTFRVKVNTISDDIGSTIDLNTTETNTVVGAINEIDAYITSIQEVELITPRLTASDALGTSIFAGSVDIDTNLNVDGDVTVGGNINLTGNITIGGESNIGDANTDSVTFAADINSNLIPDIDDTYDLGSVTQEWRNLYIDGTAQVDTLTVDENATITGDITINGNMILSATAVETVEDIVGQMVTGNSTAGISVTYTDNGAGLGKLDFNVNDPVITLSGDVAGSATMTDLGDVTISTTVQPNSVALGTDTTGNYMINVVGTDNEITVSHTQGEGSTATIGLPADVTIANSLYVTGQFQTGGDFLVAGEQKLATGTLTLLDGQVSGLADGNVRVDRGSDTDAYLRWVEANDAWYIGVDTDMQKVIREGDDATLANVIVSGNLTVSGTTTTVNTEEVNIADNIIVLNSNEAGVPSQNGGIEVERGTLPNMQFVWDEEWDRWSIGSERLQAGSVRIGDGVVLSESADRADLLAIQSNTTGFGGIQITNDNSEGLWSFMVDGNNAGLYDDQNNEWTIQATENAGVTTYYNGQPKFSTTNTGVGITGDIVVSGLVDGRDVAADGTKLDLITVTQAVDLDTVEAKANNITITQPVNLDTIETNVNTFLSSAGAGDVGYNNTVSGIVANSVQEAIDYLNLQVGGGSAGAQSTYTKNKFTATAGQTVFTIPAGYELGYIEVYFNGVLLDITDFTANDQSTVVLSEAASVGDIITTITLDSFAISEHLRVFQVSASAPDNSIIVDQNGQLSAIDFNTTSDLNLKTNIHTIENALDKVNQMRGVTFDWKDTKESAPSNVGFIAQEVAAVVPELTNTHNNTMQVKYGNMTALLLEAVKELTEQNKALSARIAKLEQE